MQLNKLFLIGLVLVLGVWMVGCSDKSSQSDNTTTEELNLTDDFGGYKATDESPAFGDDAMMELEGSVDADDPLRLRPDVDSLRQRLIDVKVYSVEFLWGHLELDSTEVDITDWSGSIAVERGGIVAVRLIRFEPGDHIVRPRLYRTELDFASFTRPSFDGLLLFIYDPEPDSFDTENTLTFTSGPYTRTFTMSELEQISEVVDVGDNQFSVNAFRVDQFACGEGFFEGRWVRPASDKGLGTFVGWWISQDGLLLGHLHGHFGQRIDGAEVMFGKWISAAGLFRGFLRGQWGFGSDEDPANTDLGWYEGQLYNRDEVVIGGYEGNWMAKEQPGNHGNGNGDNDDRADSRRAKHGYFRGQWSLNCE